MKSKYFLLVSFLVLAMFLVGCNTEYIFPVTPENLSANVTITNWSQSHQEHNGVGWSRIVQIYWELVNTGAEKIDYWEIYFIATCIDGNEYYGVVKRWSVEGGIEIGGKACGWTLIWLEGKEVISVKISEVYLNSFKSSITMLELEKKPYIAIFLAISPV